MLATTRLDVNHGVRKLMGVARVSFASGDETKALTGMLIGGVTIFALPADLPIYVDERVMAPSFIIVGGGGRSTKVKLAPDALRGLPNVNVVPGLAGEIPAGAQVGSSSSQPSGSRKEGRSRTTSNTSAARRTSRARRSAEPIGPTAARSAARARTTARSSASATPGRG